MAGSLIGRLLAAERPFTPFESLELPEETRRGAYAVKCEEDAFLLVGKDGWRFFDAAKGSAITASDPLPPSDALTGWRAELAFAPEEIAVCVFKKDAILFEGERLPVRIGALRPGLFLVSGAEGKLVLILDTDRFLFYGGADGAPVGGYVKNMPQDS
ncbi:MAG: hypothetical protein IJM21_08640 [Clostridia bacterium]|nr:hypothetical protein [Clostridia bacterium]